jgi:hypothetical protein
MNMINLTPHAITLRTPNGEDITIRPSGTVARVEMEEDDAGSIAMKQFSMGLDSIPMIRRTAGRIVGIPLGAEVYIVSSIVLDALRGETMRDRYRGVSIVAPDTGATAIRNEKGYVVAVTRLVTL